MYSFILFPYIIYVKMRERENDDHKYERDETEGYHKKYVK